MTNSCVANFAPLRLSALLMILCCIGAKAAIAEIPHLKKQGTATQLIVDGKPYLVLGGELSNSAATTLDSMKPIWSRLAQLNLNTVLVPAYWDLIEPREGEFDFKLVDGIIEDARQHNLRLVFLWFASWKNSMSCYAPEWVKTNQQRFPRSVAKDGHGMELLSPFCDANATADAQAFAAFMRHVKEVDGNQHTVIMVQVENEIGMIPDARDWSPEATRLYREPVPRELMAYLDDHREILAPELRAAWEKAGFKSAGTWEKVFGAGPASEEIFMAWHFARYTNRVAAAGKAEHALPMFVNAALVRPGYPPGRYPSAGPLPHLIDIWQAAAPQIDFLSPDIYFPNFVEWCQRYHQSGNPLFIPEAVRESRSAANIFYAVGQHDSIGLSPFAIDYVNDSQGQLLKQSYELLGELAPLILAHQGRGTMAGVVPNVPFQGTPVPTKQTVDLGDYSFEVTFEQPLEPTSLPGLDPGQWLSGGVIVCEGHDEFVIAGTGLVATFAPRGPNTAQEKVGISSIQEGHYADGEWQLHRWLSGDESHQGRHLRIPAGQFGTQRVKLYRYR